MVLSGLGNYDNMVLSGLAKGGLESGVWFDEYNYPNKDKKKNITKSTSMFFFRAVYHSKNYVIPHSVIASFLDAILNISKRRKQQQYASQILQKQPLLKTMGK